MKYYKVIKKMKKLHVLIWKDLYDILLGNKSKYKIPTFV